MNNLDEIRVSINEVDLKIIEDFKTRMELAKKVALYKKENNLPIYDAAREKALIDKNINALNDKELEVYYLKIFKEILKQSKEYQKKIIDNE